MKSEYKIKSFNNFNIFDIDLSKLRSKNFYKDMISNRDHYYKKYKKYLNTKKKISCHLCKNNNNIVFANYKKYILRECLCCGVIFSNVNLTKFLNSDFFEINDVKFKDFKQEMVKTFDYRKKNFGSERLKYIKKNIFPKKKSFTVLDYGCGSGYFLSVLKDNKIKGRGIDLDKNAINFCRTKKLDATTSSLTKEPNGKYDLITMFDSIEHLYDPIKELKDVSKKLKKNSYILAFTPNIHSLSFELMGINHNMLAVFDHICFFNLKSLNYLSKKTGLKIKSIEFFGLDVKDYFQSVPSKHNMNLNKLLNKFDNLTQSIIDNQKLSNSMRIVFQKK